MKIDGDMIENFISHYFFLTVDWTWLIVKALLAIKVLDVLIFGVQYEKHIYRRPSLLGILYSYRSNYEWSWSHYGLQTEQIKTKLLKMCRAECEIAFKSIPEGQEIEKLKERKLEE